jgi:DNA-binding MarR family transcriptional regulator
MIRRDTLLFRTLVAMARQRPEFDEPRCHALLELFAVSEDARERVQRGLQTLDLTELQFGVLVVLLSVDPTPSSPAALADNTCVSRAAITDALDHLTERRLINRERSHEDRRMHLISLAQSGRELAEKAAGLVLHLLGDIARPLDGPAPRALLVLCDKLLSRSAPLAAR